MDYTPHVLIKKLEFEEALRVKYDDFRIDGHFVLPITYRNDIMRKIIEKQGLESEGLLNGQFQDKTHTIEGVEYYWFWTAFAHEAKALIEFLRQYKVTHYVSH